MDDQERLKAALVDLYRIESVIDTGGMATVYRARDLKHDRTVAIKVLRPDLAKAIGADRFLREIRTTANLSHRHILPLFDSGEAAGSLYYVMPFVEGESLRDRLEREGQVPVKDAVQIAREVAEALDYAHEQGVIHRDIKPANIMLERGHALLADFGIAQANAGGDETRLTWMGMSLGTPSYMSPEQITGNREVGGRSDQYALGCVLYEMLSGHPPFPGSNVQAVLRQHLATQAPSVSLARPAVPKGLAKTVRRALAKSAADRFRTMEEFEKALAGATMPLLARIPMGRARVAGYAFGALVLVVVVWGLSTRFGGLGAGGNAAAGWQPDPQVVAVAPFRNLTRDSAYENLAGRVALEVERRLSGADIGEVRSVDRVLPVLSAAGETADPVTLLSQELGAGTVVTGIIDLVGDSLEIQAYCTDAGTGNRLAHLDPVRGPPANQQALVSEIRDRVAGALALRLDPGNPYQATSTPPLNPEAYAEYRRGVELHANPEDWEEAADHFLRAFELDSTYLDAGIKAFVDLHQISQLGADRWDEVDSVLSILDRSVDRMNQAQRHGFLGLRALLMSNDAETALREIRLAAADDPEEWAYNQGHTALFLNRTTEAIQAFQRWEKGEGEFLEGFFRLWPAYFTEYADALHRQGRHEEELRIVRDGRERFPDYWRLIREELRAHIGLGHVEEARSLFREVRRFQGRSFDGQDEIIWLAQECFAHGLDDLGREVLEEEVGMFETEPGYAEHPETRGNVLHFLGRNEEAFTLFRARADSSPNNPFRGLFQMGMIAPLLGDTDLALEIDRRLAEWPRGGWSERNILVVRAQIQANLGNLEEAYRLIEDAYFRHGRLFQSFQHAIFDLLPLQGYAPYEDLMRDAG